MNSFDALNAITRRALRVNYYSPAVCLPDSETGSGSGGGSPSTLDFAAVYRNAGPAALTATLVEGPAAFLEWTAASGAYAYVVYTSTSPEGPWTVIASGVQGTTYQWDLSSVGAHYFKVTGIEPNYGETYASPVASVTVPQRAGPATLESATLPAPEIFLIWTAVSGALEYRIYTADNPAGPFTLRPEFVDGSLTVFNLTSGIVPGLYYIYITAVEPQWGETLPSPTTLATVV